ncbi:hypothetical protein INT48_004203 [Thamnidium elegans]|uniref:Uncharacterized protein n=1 Tax=Thamnidium elegans TaxID=101142 RepID=A0A8H7VT35_9FUNG|nr:hypothetical protein INT48_004203 [Thamnidium elegans]
MYPSLTSVASSSRWYSKKQSAQDKLIEITQMEEKLAEKRLKNVQVGATILIRGKPSIIDPTSISNQEDTRAMSDDDNIMYSNDTSNDLFDNQYEQDIPQSHHGYSHYNSYSSPS